MDRPLAARLLNRIPRSLYAPLRKARTAALIAAEPLDYVHRKITGRGDVPPLWLRRHVGTIPSFDRSPGEMTTAIAFLDLVHEADTVLDVACGCGLMAFEFQRMLGPEGRYVGFDVHAPAIRWARRHFAADPRLRFELAELATAYSEEFDAPVTQYRFPTGDASVHFALAKSIFTHLLEADARHYLAEVRRVLAPEGRALLTTLFVDERGRPTREGAAPPPLPPMYTFPFGGPHFWYAVEAKPAAVVGVTREYFLRLAADAGLRVHATYDGYWRGLRVAPNAQDLVVVGRA